MANYHPICLVTVDDGTMAISRHSDEASTGGISSVVDCMINGRALGIGVIGLINSLSAISDIARQNTSGFFTCSVSGENPWILKNTLGLTTEQIEQFRVKSAKPGNVIVYNPVLFDKPVHGVSTLLPIPGRCDENIRQASVARFMKKVIFSAPAPTTAFGQPVLPLPAAPARKKQPAPTFPDIPQRHTEFLMQIVSSLPVPVGVIYARMSLGSIQGRRTTKALENLGFIALHAFSTGRIGGRIVLVEITPVGWSFLATKGFKQPASKTKGGWEHETAAILIEAEGRRQGFKVSFEISLGTVQADVQWLDSKTGQKTLFNIGISRPVHEADSIEKFLKLPISTQCKFVMVARDSNFAKKLQKALTSKKLDKALLKRVQLQLIADFIPKEA